MGERSERRVRMDRSDYQGLGLGGTLQQAEASMLTVAPRDRTNLARDSGTRIWSPFCTAGIVTGRLPAEDARLKATMYASRHCWYHLQGFTRPLVSTNMRTG